jgi:hypothetical protein
MCFAATGRLQGRAAKLLRERWQSPGILRDRRKFALQLTARQYGEVVLPDAAPLQSCPGRLQSGPGARRVWRVFLPSWYKVLSKPGVSQYKFDRSQEFITVQNYKCEHLSSIAVQG